MVSFVAFKYYLSNQYTRATVQVWVCGGGGAWGGITWLFISAHHFVLLLAVSYCWVFGGAVDKRNTEVKGVDHQRSGVILSFRNSLMANKYT